MTREELLLQIQKLSDEDQKILAWKLVGQNLRPWTEAQQVAYLLDTLTCPEGHMAPFSHFFLDGTTHTVTKEPGKMVPIHKRFEDQDGFDVPDMDGIYCDSCAKLSIEPNFWAPEYVLKHFFEKE